MSHLDDEVDPATPTVTFTATDDVCTQLTSRYATSSAIQHRHLIATATAVKSLIADDPSLPLSPLSYFAATITAISNTSRDDTVSISALATLLSIVLPLIPEGSVSPKKAADAAAVLVRVLDGDELGLGFGVGSGCSTVRCFVKCLGVLLGFCNSRDWDSVELPFQALLKASLDKRPKVRKCSLLYLENVLKAFQRGAVRKKASRSIQSLLESYASSEFESGSIRHVDGSKQKKQSESEHSDVAHVLNVVKVTLPYLSDKISVEVVLKLVKLLDARFSALSRIILDAIEGFIDNSEAESIIQVAGDMIPVLALYVSSKNNHKDSNLSAAKSLKCLLCKIHAGDADKWKESLLPVFNAIAGLLSQEDDVASQASNMLKELICHFLGDNDSDPATDVTNDVRSKLTTSICSTLLDVLDYGVEVPNEHTLAVISVLFLKLGESSFIHMSNFVSKLAEIFTTSKDDNLNKCYVEKCFGCAIVAMGAEKVLSLVPISFSVEHLTCSNTWLLPILKEYVIGDSIGYFVEHIVPIVKDLRKASRKVKKSVIGQDLQALARSLWGLLPAFCRYPIDIRRSLQSFTKLVLAQLKKDPSTHEDITLALQELVRQSKCLPKSDGVSAELTKPSSDDPFEYYLLEKRSLCHFSKKEASKNLKALSSCSHEILQALVDIFLVSPSGNRSSLKKGISCLASISDPSVTKKIFILSLERFPSLKAFTESGGGDSDVSVNDASCDSSSITNDSEWCLTLDLASSIVEGADKNLLDLIFKLVKHALKAGDKIILSEAYSTLSCVLEGHPRFCSSKMDELVDLLIGLKSPADVATLSNRLSNLHTLLVHALLGDFDADNKKPFLVLNEIILALKDSKEEARKAAYDILLRLSSSLGGSSVATTDGPYYKLISMILGYLSGPSPHITSAAISALSVLVFKEPQLCLVVPDVIPSITSLLQSKAVEVIKAVLGFIKVLVSCLEAKDLHNFISAIVDGIIPWSSVSRHHFKSKVTVILEIMMRKCGVPAVKLVTPERYQNFVKNVSHNRHGKTKETDSADTKPQLSDASFNGQKKRVRDNTHDKKTSFESDRKRRKFAHDDRPHGGTKGTGGGKDRNSNCFNRPHSKTFGMKGGGVGGDKGNNRFKNSKPRAFNGPGKFADRGRKENFGQSSGKFRKQGRPFAKKRE